MEKDIGNDPDMEAGPDPLALMAELLRRQTAEAIAHLREQAARMHAGLPPDPGTAPGRQARGAAA